MGVWTPGPGPTTGNDNFTGDNTNETASGGDGNDTLNGNGGNDTLNGDANDDTITGGLGTDTLNGGAGNDTFVWVFGDGGDTIDGGLDTDTLNISDGASANILNATFNGASLTVVAGNTLTNVESVNVNMGGGVDWLIYSAGSAAITVNLGAGTASGFASVSNIENVIGGNANDNLTGSALADRLDGGAGDDALNGGGGIDTIIGGEGADTISGGLGNDSLQGGNGNDTFNWAVGDGRDTITGGNDVDTANFTGTAVAELGNATWNGSVLTALLDNGLSGIEAVNLDLGGGVDWLIYNATAAVVVDLGAGTASGFASVINVEKVIGGSGGDTLTGDGLDNRLDGQGGNDTLNGGAGSDTVLGGDGDDTIYASAGNDSLQGLNGNDTFHWTATDGRDTFSGGADFDTVNLTGSAAADVADANWNGSAITGLLNNALIDIEAINLDLGAGGSGGDWLRYNTAFGVSVNLATNTGTGFASITGVENLIGGAGNDALIGDGAANKINGNTGDDTISGGLGADTLTGGGGNDTFNWAWGDGGDVVDGGGDTDTINFTGNASQNFFSAQYNGAVVTSAAGVSFVSVEALNVDMGGGEDWLSYTTTAAVIVNLTTGTASGFASITGLENAIGGSGNDTLTGDAGANRLQGSAGSDTLNGGGGDDIIDGGADNDTATYAGAGAGVTVDLQITSAQNTGGAGTDTITNVENLTGSAFDDSLVGNASANMLIGGDGADTLNGGGGDDTFDGGDGVDTATYAGAGAGVTVDLQITAAQNTGGAGTDTIANVENLFGSAFNDTLAGNASANVLIGGVGQDAIYGEDGDDLLLVDGTLDSESGETYDGGGGFDTLQALGVGAETAEFRFSTLASIEALTLENMTAHFAGEAVNAGLAAALAVDGLGVDNHLHFQRTTAGATDLSAFTFQNWSGGSQVTLEGSGGDDVLTGSSQVNTILGGAGADTLVGGAVADFLTGGAGLDVVSGGAGVDHLYVTAAADLIAGETYDGGSGTDDHIWLQAAGTYSFVGVNVASLELLVLNASGIDVTLSAESLGAGFATGLRIDAFHNTALINVVRSTAGTTNLATWAFFNPGGTQVNLVGSSGNDVLTGSSLHDTISGGDGADTITAGSGNDTLIGGIGNDTYVVNTAATITENAGEGTDTVLTSLSMTLVSELENATVVGAAGLTITGNASNNVITGGAGSDTLTGAGGADTLSGGGDSDFLTGGAGLDIVSGGDASDHIYINAASDLVAGESYDGGAHIDDHIWLQASGSYSFVGVTVANLELLVLNATGIDVTLDGASLGAGFATALRVEAFNNGGIINVVRSTAGTTSLASWAFFNPGALQINITGSTGADTLTGSSRADTINGGDGADTLMGGGGADTLNGGDANDVLSFTAVAQLSAGEVLNGGDGFDTLLLSGFLQYNLRDTATISSIEAITFTGGTQVQATMGSSQFGAGMSNSLVITGSASINYVDVYVDSGTTFSTAGWTFVSWSSNDILSFYGAAGAETITGTSQADGIYAEGGNDTVNGGDGNDSLFGRTGDDTLNGENGADTLQGEGGNDILNGADGADTLQGGDNNDTLIGGLGMDSLSGGNGDDMLRMNDDAALQGGEVYDGGAGTDTLVASLDINDVRNATVTSIERAQFVGLVGTQVIYLRTEAIGSGFSATLEVDGGNIASAAMYVYRTSAGTTDVSGWTFLNWSAASYVGFSGSTGADVFIGSSVNDLIVADSGDDTLSGGQGDDSLDGGAGADTLDGGAGADAMSGGANDDTYVVDAAGDAVTENASAGTDLVQASISYTLGANVEQLTLTGSADIDGTGNTLSNIINGNGGANTLSGDSGSDDLYGNGGADTLIGASGTDRLYGGDGDDALRMNDNSALLAGEVYDGGAGTDTLVASLDINDVRNATVTSIERAQFVGAVGTQVIYLRTEAIGTGFSSTLQIDGGNITSAVMYIYRTSAGTTDVSGWTFTNWSASSYVGFSGSSGADVLIGSSVNDLMVADAGADTLTSGSGDDNLDGGAGNDTLEGGAGTDTLNGGADTDTATYANAASGVTVSLAAAGAQNTVGAGADTLSNIENLTGSAFNDTLTGNSAANVINGGNGDDIIEGGDGNDNLDGAGGTDTLSYANASAGITISFALFGSTQNTGGAGTDTINNFENLIGSSFNDTLSGNGNDNTIDGGAGIDTISYAGVGNVIICSLALQGAGQSTFAGGVDTLFNFENLTGSDNGDTLGGDGNNNVIIGNGGNDSITGAGGVDTLTGGLGNDTFVYAAGAGSDTITDFDADASGGQDLINITAFGITGGDFATRVTITDLGSDTLITIDGSVTITLTGVTGDANNVITQSDFIFGP